VVIDWGDRGARPRTFDLVSLTSGKWTDDERQAMRVAYFEQLQLESGQPLNWETFCASWRRSRCISRSSARVVGAPRGLSRGFLTFRNELARVLKTR